MTKQELVEIIKKEFYQCDLEYLTTRGFSDLADTIIAAYGNPQSASCKNENMGRCQGYTPELKKQCVHGIPLTFSCLDCKKEEL